MVRLTHHVPKQSKTKVMYFTDLLIFGNEDLNLTGFHHLNFPPKNSHIAYSAKNFFRKNHLCFCGVVVSVHASHAKGPKFKSHLCQ